MASQFNVPAPAFVLHDRLFATTPASPTSQLGQELGTLANCSPVISTAPASCPGQSTVKLAPGFAYVPWLSYKSALWEWQRCPETSYIAIKGFCPEGGHHSELSDLLNDLLGRNAVASDAQLRHSLLKRLEAAGFCSCEDGSDYRLTSKALDSLMFGGAVVSPRSVLALPDGKKPNTWHALHLVDALSRSGWTWRKLSKQRM